MIQKLILFTGMLFLFSLKSQAAAVLHCDSILQTGFCPGGNILIPYTVTSGSVPLATSMTAQMSDFFGSFNTPINIGTSPFNIGTVLATIPAGTTFGFLYRVRVIANTATPDTSSNSPNTIIIAAPPVPTVNSNPGDTVCMGDTISLNAGLPVINSYKWFNVSSSTILDTNNTYKVTVAGTYKCTVTNPLGCSATSLSHIVYFKPSAVPTIIQNGAVLISSHASFYQWNDVSGPVAGATSQSFTPPGNGTYSVTVHDSLGCTPTSTTIIYTVGINELNSGTDFQIYPNPAASVIFIKNNSIENSSGKIRISDVLGETILEKTIQLKPGMNQNSIDLQGISKGIYFLEVNQNSGKSVKSFIVE